MTNKLLIFSFFLLFAGMAWSGSIDRRSRIGPTGVTTAENTIASAGAGRSNCLSNLDARNQSDYTLRILDGGTTVYAVSLTSGTTIVRAWDDNDMCGTANTAMYVNISSVSASGTLQINYIGYTY